MLRSSPRAFLALLLLAAAVSGRQPWDPVPQHVITDRPLLQVFPNGTFAEAALPLLVEQARAIMPYVMRSDNGIDDSKLPTFWLAAGAPARFALEQAVVRIAELDFPDGGLAAAGVAGMEWWCQVSEEGTGSGTMHFDKDEGAASMEQKMIMAMRSTVTYLTDAGSPTAVFHARYKAGPVYEVEEIATEGWIVMPRRNKHISFQGDLYHGIFHHVYPDGARRLRATLLVNYWAKQPLAPYCVPMPLQGAGDFASLRGAAADHPPQPRHGAPEAILEIDMSEGREGGKEGAGGEEGEEGAGGEGGGDGGYGAKKAQKLKRFPLPCDTGIRRDFVWLPPSRPPAGSTSHVVWPPGATRTERQFSHVRASRFAGDPLPAAGEEARLLGGGRPPYALSDPRADHTAAAIDFDEAGDAAAAVASFRAAARFAPTLSEVWSNLGMALLDEQGHAAGWAEAEAVFRRAVGLDPANEQAVAHLASGGKDEL